MACTCYSTPQARTDLPTKKKEKKNLPIDSTRPVSYELHLWVIGKRLIPQRISEELKNACKKPHTCKNKKCTTKANVGLICNIYIHCRHCL